MSISVKCFDCGKVLKAPDGLAGKKAKCPGCGAIVPIPKAALDAEAIDDDEPVSKPKLKPKPKPKAKAKPKPVNDDDAGMFDDLADYEAEAPIDESATRKPCPMCGEKIAKGAAKCRYCGEVLDPALRKKAKKKSSSSSSGDEELTGFDIALCVLCGGIACIVGIVHLCRGQSSRGGKMIGISFLAGFVWRVIGLLIEQMAKN